MKNIFFTFCFSSLLFFSCSKSGQNTNKDDNGEINNEEESAGTNNNLTVLDANKYVQWMKNTDNGFRNEKVIDDLSFSVQYKTPEYIICMEQRGQKLNDTTVKQKISELDEMQYYDLRITMNEGQGELLKYKLSSIQQYNERVNYFAFNMENDIRLVDGNDTLTCGLYHFERAYDVSPTAVVLLAFAKNKNSDKKDKTLVIYDRTYNKGMLKFKFRANVLTNKPKLKTL